MALVCVIPVGHPARHQEQGDGRGDEEEHADDDEGGTIVPRLDPNPLAGPQFAELRLVVPDQDLGFLVDPECLPVHADCAALRVNRLNGPLQEVAAARRRSGTLQELHPVADGRRINGEAATTVPTNGAADSEPPWACRQESGDVSRPERPSQGERNRRRMTVTRQPADGFQTEPVEQRRSIFAPGVEQEGTAGQVAGKGANLCWRGSVGPLPVRVSHGYQPATRGRLGPGGGAHARARGGS